MLPKALRFHIFVAYAIIVHLRLKNSSPQRGIKTVNFFFCDFQGVAIGNGYLSEETQRNSYVLWANYHGIIGVE